MDNRRHCIRVLAIGILLVAACDREEPVARYQAPRDNPFPAATAVAGTESAPVAGGLEHMHWTLPANWKLLPEKKPMRYATLVASGENSLEVAISLLGGAAGGLLANVNRWGVQQMGLDPVDESTISNVVTEVDLADGVQAHVVDLTSAGDDPRRMLVAVIPRPGTTWFMKAFDNTAAVTEHEETLLAIIRSVHFAAAPTAAAPTAPAAPGRSASANVRNARWQAPGGWKKLPAGQMGLAAFAIATEGEPLKVTVSRFPGNVGGLLANLNRWRGQVGLEPVARSEDQPVKALKVGGEDGLMIHLTGAGDDPAGLVVVLVRQGGRTWFFKMNGRATSVAKHLTAFQAFVESVRFEGSE